MLWDRSQSKNGVGRKGRHDGFLALGIWAGSLGLPTSMAGIVVDLFAVLVVCALTSERAEIARAEEGVEVVVLCLVFDHGLAQIAHESRTSPVGEEGARKCAGWRKGQGWRVGL